MPPPITQFTPGCVWLNLRPAEERRSAGGFGSGGGRQSAGTKQPQLGVLVGSCDCDENHWVNP